MGTITTQHTDWMGRPIASAKTRQRVVQGEDASSVPDGSVTEVREWVGYDPDRAKAALVSEHARPEPRKTLIDALERVVTKES